MNTKTLLVLRHAKSSWKDPDLLDHDRPLNKRGRQAATKIGRLILDEGMTPSLIFCSTALRTRETAQLAFAGTDPYPKIVFREDLYHAEPERIALILSQIDQPILSVQIIGHNPGLELFLARMTGESIILPTGALAKIDLELTNWNQFSELTRGTLVKFWKPRELE